VGFWKLQKHVTEVPDRRYYLVETENQYTCSIMVFLKQIVPKGCFSCFISFFSQRAGAPFTVIS
jgi:hypothetical protein